MSRLTDTEARRLKRLAGRADALLQDADFKDMLTDLKNSAIRDWAESKDAAAREQAWHSLQAVGRLENIMRKYGELWRTNEKNHG